MVKLREIIVLNAVGGNFTKSAYNCTLYYESHSMKLNMSAYSYQQYIIQFATLRIKYDFDTQLKCSHEKWDWPSTLEYIQHYTVTQSVRNVAK